MAIDGRWAAIFVTIILQPGCKGGDSLGALQLGWSGPENLCEVIVDDDVPERVTQLLSSTGEVEFRKCAVEGGQASMYLADSLDPNIVDGVCVRNRQYVFTYLNGDTSAVYEEKLYTDVTYECAAQSPYISSNILDPSEIQKYIDIIKSENVFILKRETLEDNMSVVSLNRVSGEIISIQLAADVGESTYRMDFLERGGQLVEFER